MPSTAPPRRLEAHTKQHQGEVADQDLPEMLNEIGCEPAPEQLAEKVGTKLFFVQAGPVEGGLIRMHRKLAALSSSGPGAPSTRLRWRMLDPSSSPSASPRAAANRTFASGEACC
jgi:hypothetical protein